MRTDGFHPGACRKAGFDLVVVAATSANVVRLLSPLTIRLPYWRRA